MTFRFCQARDSGFCSFSIVLLQLGKTFEINFWICKVKAFCDASTCLQSGSTREISKSLNFEPLRAFSVASISLQDCVLPQKGILVSDFILHCFNGFLLLFLKSSFTFNFFIACFYQLCWYPLKISPPESNTANWCHIIPHLANHPCLPKLQIYLYVPIRGVVLATLNPLIVAKRSGSERPVRD